MDFLDTIDILDHHKTPWHKRAVAVPLLFMQALWEQFSHDKVIIRALGLAYSSLLATVPLVAVLFAMFSAFAAFDNLRERVQDLLFSQLLPTRQDEIVSYINQFTANTSRLGLFGFVFLIVAAIMLLDSVESNFNEIWHVRRARGLVSKLTSYTSVLVFGSLFIGASLSISARIKTLLFTGTVIELNLLSKISAWLGPFLLTLLAFLLSFQIIPNTRVRFKSSLAGALVAAALWEIAKNLFALFVGQSVGYSTIYGSLAVIPIFLIWLYITWVIVLLGLEISFTHQHFSSLIRHRSLRDPDCRDLLGLVLKCFGMAALRFHHEAKPPTADEIAEETRLPFEMVERGLDRLVAANLVRQVSVGKGVEGFMPALPLDKISLADVARTVFRDNDRRPAEQPLARSVDERLGRIQQAGFAALGEDSVLELLAEVAAEEPPAAVSADAVEEAATEEG